MQHWAGSGRHSVSVLPAAPKSEGEPWTSAAILHRQRRLGTHRLGMLTREPGTNFNVGRLLNRRPCQMRFLPTIRYGTEGYPEKVARRLRTLNVTTWTTAAAVTSAAVAHFLDPTPGLWKLASVDSIGGAIFASVPLLHRFGISAALTFIIVADTYFFALIYLIGTGVGVHSRDLSAGARGASVSTSTCTRIRDGTFALCRLEGPKP